MVLSRYLHSLKKFTAQLLYKQSPILFYHFIANFQIDSQPIFQIIEDLTLQTILVLN